MLRKLNGEVAGTKLALRRSKEAAESNSTSTPPAPSSLKQSSPSDVQHKGTMRESGNQRETGLSPSSNSTLIEVDPTQLPVYTYSTLPTGQSIRLLSVRNQNLVFPNKATQIICSISVYNFNDTPAYSALSYTWGPPIDDPKCAEEYANSRDWILEDRGNYFRISVTRNLYEALKRLTEDINPVFVMWIDAICICQTDLSERASQVGMMGDIYTRCKETVVWLGEAEELGRDIANFSRIHEIITPALGLYSMIHGTEALYIALGERPSEDAFYELLNLDPLLCQFDWRVYYQFYYERMWFKRVWVYQEVSLAPDVSFRCGIHTFTLNELARVSYFLGNSGLTSEFLAPFFDEFEFPTVHSPWMQIRVIYSVRQNCLRIGSERGYKDCFDFRLSPDKICASYRFFLYCLQELRRADATDPRDKIFAALGYLQRHLPDGISSKILPDYTISITDVYIKAATVLLQELPDLSLLCRVEDPSFRKLKDLPSWVPDFTVYVQPIRNGGPPYLYNATLCTGKEKLGPSIVRVDGLKLLLKGTQLDEVANTQVEPPAALAVKETDSLQKHILMIIQSWFNLLNAAEHWLSISPYKESILEVLWHTLCENQLDGGAKIVMSELSNQTFHDFLLGWSIYLRVQRHQSGSMEFEDLMSLIGEHSHGPCWPGKAKIKECTEIDGQIFNPFEEPGHWSDEAQSMLDMVSQNTGGFCKVVDLHCKDRLLFVTRGGWFGLGPQSVQKGDQVWLIEGSRLPFILRLKADGCFTLIGETYVHGCMNGGMWRKLRNKVTDVCLA